jgi:5-methylcytosine-specific restriction endonuclease McrA
MDQRLRREVRERSGDRCEYCRIPQAADQLPFQVDHIIAEAHHGETVLSNLAWSCFDCNVYKGTNLSGVDPDTGLIVPLFHPRNDYWHDHFQWQGARLLGKTQNGRATIEVLRLNMPSRIEHRRLLSMLGELTTQ